MGLARGTVGFTGAVRSAAVGNLGGSSGQSGAGE